MQLVSIDLSIDMKINLQSYESFSSLNFVLKEQRFGKKRVSFDFVYLSDKSHSTYSELNANI